MNQADNNPEQWLVAHRGDQSHEVENTLKAFAAAVDGGALFAECDIQFSRDLVPVVIHDNHLKRLCDLDLHISLLDLVDLKELCYPYFKLLLLRKFLTWLKAQPHLTLFIEVKPDVRERISDADIAGVLAREIDAPLLPQIVIISESAGILEACRSKLNCRIGWVAEGSDEPACPLDYVFMHHAAAATIAAWHERGVKVGLYTINDVELAAEMRRLGADLIESDHFSRLQNELAGGHGSE